MSKDPATTPAPRFTRTGVGQGLKSGGGAAEGDKVLRSAVVHRPNSGKKSVSYSDPLSAKSTPVASTKTPKTPFWVRLYPNPNSVLSNIDAKTYEKPSNPPKQPQKFMDYNRGDLQPKTTDESVAQVLKDNREKKWQERYAKKRASVKSTPDEVFARLSGDSEPEPNRYSGARQSAKDKSAASSRPSSGSSGYISRPSSASSNGNVFERLWEDAQTRNNARGR